MTDKFTVDAADFDDTNDFMTRGASLPTVDQHYQISGWVKQNADGSVTITDVRICGVAAEPEPWHRRLLEYIARKFIP